MLRYPTYTSCDTLNGIVIATLMMFVTDSSALSSNVDTLCKDSKAFLDQKFEASGMLSTKDTIIAVIRDSEADQTERYLSLLVLGCSGDQEMAAVMLDVLDDPDSEVRMGVIIGMRYLKSPTAIAPMVAIVRDSSDDENVRQLASGVLSQIAAGNSTVAAAIGEAARDTAQNLNVRLNHVFSLGRMTSTAAVVELETLLADDNPDILATTAIALAQHEVEESVPYLVEAVLSPYTQFWLKAKAARYLEQLVDQDFSFTTGNGFKTYYGGAAKDDEFEPALAEIYDWWQQNKHKYQSGR